MLCQKIIIVQFILFLTLLRKSCCDQTPAAAQKEIRGREYFIYNTSLTFVQSRNFCQSQNASLAHIKNGVTQKSIEMELENLTSPDNGTMGLNLSYWTSGTRINSTTWAWGDRSRLPILNQTGFQAWFNDQPVPDGPGLRVAMIGVKAFGSYTNAIGKWIRQPAWVLHGFVCQKDIDECAIYDSLCHENEQCRNWNGGYMCDCQYNNTIAECESARIIHQGKKYTFYNSRVNYNRSVSLCRSQNSSLVTVGDNKTQQVINHQLRKLENLDSVKSQRRSSYWTSGVRQNADNAWKWGDGSVIPLSGEHGFSNWAIGEPNRGLASLVRLGLLGTNLNTSLGNIGKWLDLMPTRKLKFICQRDMYLRELYQPLRRSFERDTAAVVNEITGPILLAYQSVLPSVTNIFFVEENNFLARYQVQVEDRSITSENLIQAYKSLQNFEFDYFEGNPIQSFCQSFSYRNFTFNDTLVGEISYSNEKCAQGYSQASINCIAVEETTDNGILFASKFNESTLDAPSCVLDLEIPTQNSTFQNSTQKYIENTTDTLRLLTSGENLTETTAEKIIEVLEDITNDIIENNITVSEKILFNVVTISSHLQLTTSSKQDQEGNVVTNPYSIVIAINKLSSRVVLDSNTTEFTIKTDNINLKIIDIPSDDRIRGLSFSPDVRSRVYEKSSHPVNITLPGEVFAGNRTKRVVFVLFRNDSFFPSTENADWVISAQVGDDEIRGLSAPVVIEYKYESSHYGKGNKTSELKVEFVRQRCVFWDEETLSWSSNGCVLDQSQHPPLCLCDHLTSFGLLVTTTEIPADVALSISSIVGCAITCAALLATIILYLTNKSVRGGIPAQTQIHIYVNLLIAYLLFLIGVTQPENKACQAVTLLLHYFFLTSWFWMAVYSRRLYLSLVVVYIDEVANYIMKACLFAYGIPVVIISISVGITVGHFDHQLLNTELLNPYENRMSYYFTDNFCWIHGYSLYFGFLIFVGIILLHSVIVVILVTWKVIIKRKQIQSSKSKVSKSKELIMFVSMSFTLGLTWLIGVFFLISDDPVYHLALNWLFTIINAYQGIFIFYLACVRRQDVFDHWFVPIRRKVSAATRRYRGNLAVSTSSQATNPLTPTLELKSIEKSNDLGE